MKTHKARGKAVLVRFHGPTDQHPAGRWSVRAEGTATYFYKRHSLDPKDTGDPAENAARAAEKYIHGYEWGGDWYGGQLPNGDYVFVMGPS
jgi:hypothetical protein